MSDDECVEEDSFCVAFELTPKAFREYAKWLVEQGEAKDSDRVMWANEQAAALEDTNA